MHASDIRDARRKMVYDRLGPTGLCVYCAVHLLGLDVVVVVVLIVHTNQQYGFCLFIRFNCASIRGFAQLSIAQMKIHIFK